MSFQRPDPEPAPSGGDPPTPTGRVPDGRKARTRAAIVGAAERLFADQGYAHTTLDQVASAAGVSVGSIYVHFGSKERLQLVITKLAMDTNDAYIQAAQQAESPLQRVLGVGDAYLRFALEHTEAFRFLTMRHGEPLGDAAPTESERLITERLAGILASIAADLQEAMDVGEIRVVPIEDAMAFLWGAWSGVASLIHRDDGLAISPEHATRALELGKQTLVAGMRPDPGAA